MIIGLLNEGGSVLIKNNENLTPLGFSSMNQLKKLNLLEQLKNENDVLYIQKIMKSAKNKFKSVY